MTEHRPAARFEDLDPDPLSVHVEERYTHTDRFGRAHLIAELKPGRVRRRWHPALAGAAGVLAGFVLGFVVASLSSRTEARAVQSAGMPREAAREVVTGDAAAIRAWPSDAAPSTLDATYRGSATWYCGHGSACTRGYSGSDLVAAIDPSTGIDKGELVTVRHDGRTVLVRIVDTCQCAGRRVIDLTSGAFSRLAPLSAGVIPVTLMTGTSLPNTDMAGEEAIR